MKIKIIFLNCFLLIVSLITYAQPPIEVIYFKPSDIEYPEKEDIDFVREIMIEVQAFFASEMDRYGFGKKSFDFNSEISVIAGKRSTKDYTVLDMIVNETHKIDWEIQNKIDIVFVAGLKDLPSGRGDVDRLVGLMLPRPWRWPGANQQPDDYNWLGVIALDNRSDLVPIVTAHEIAHAFGVHHSRDEIPNRINLMDTLILRNDITENLKNRAIRQKDAKLLNESGRLSIQDLHEPSNQEVDADVNNDGYVDLSDVLIVRSGVNHKSSYNTDVNGDGITNEIDVLIVKAKAHESIAAAAPSKRKIKLKTWAEIKRR